MESYPMKQQRINSLMILTDIGTRFRTVWLVSLICLFSGTVHRLDAQTISRDLDVSLLIKARNLGIAPGKMKKAELIHAIQLVEGNTPCFGKSNGQCPYTDCCFMGDCLKIRF